MNSLLSADFPGAQQLREQVPHAEVVATWGQGSPSVDLVVSHGSVRADIADGEVPVDAQVHDLQGNCTGEITVWVTDGYLAGIEYAWITDDRPQELPPLAQVTLVV
ncbi:hypothetical protein [Nocardia jiangxiensis]|uniref:hypothetical protein n=1 Tax=Nocardia jiangxiensis TaxID=282685 RepID=UPI0012F67C14|nr:hypothetical protein [Nocardia jiangxiensis]